MTAPGESFTPYRVLVTGSRDWPKAYEHVIWHELDTLWLRLPPDASTLPGQITVVHGQCPYGGVDLYADNWAKFFNQNYERHPARRVNGRFLGPERNSEMVNLGADICVGFPMADSKGTWDCMKKAVAADIDTYMVAWSSLSARAWDHERPAGYPAPDQQVSLINP